MKRILLIALLLLLCSAESFASLGVQTVWEINASATGGANVNGGGFDPITSVGNMIADLACTSGTTSAPNCSSATYNFVAGDVGHWLFISSGTGFTSKQFCQIASVDGSNHAVLTAGAGTCNIYNAANWTTNTSAGVGSSTPSSGVFAIDRSRKTAAAQTTTTATNTTGTITVGGLTYDKTYIGNIVQIVAGTGATQGWYAITNSTAGTNFVLDRDPSGTTNISINIGGAISLGSSTSNRTDDNFFDLGTGTNGTGAMFYWAVSGTYTMGGSVSNALTGGTQAPVHVNGYDTVRGEVLAEASWPTFVWGTNTATFNANWNWNQFKFTGTGATMLTLTGADVLSNCVLTNTSTTTTRIAVAMSSDSVISRCGVQSYFGTAIGNSNVTFTVIDSYIHDSMICITTSATASVITIKGNVFSGCVTDAIIFTGAQTSRTNIEGNTIFGSAASQLGIGLSIASGGTDFILRNNIITGLATGVTHADSTQSVGYDNFNDYYNNGTDVTNWQKGASSIATNPSFASVAGISGSTATTTAGNHLVQTGAAFVSSGVTPGRDFVYISGGTGPTVGVYGIASVDSETQITTDVTLTANGTGDKAWQITKGKNFLPTVTLAGSIGALEGGYTTGYSTIGAVQKSSAGGSGGIIGQ